MKNARFPAEEAAAERLVAYYRDIDAQLHEALLQAVRGSWNRRRIEALLAQVKAELERLTRVAGEWARDETPKAVGRGVTAARAASVLGDERAAFFGLPTAALEAIAVQAAGKIAERTAVILRQSEDFLRTLQENALVRSLGGAIRTDATARVIREGAIDALRRGQALQQLAGNLNAACSVVYANGAEFSLDSYAKMAARTGLIAANMEGRKAYWQAEGVPLWRISSHGTVCPQCYYYEGKLVAANAVGVAMGYPMLPLPPYHPHCAHVYTPVFATGPNDEAAPEWLGTTSRKDLRRRFVEEQPQLADWERRGFFNTTQGKRADERGVKWGPRHHDPGIEQRRILATRWVLEGKYPTYRQALAAVNVGRLRRTA